MKLTRRQLAVLQMLDKGEELVWDAKAHTGYVGNHTRVGATTITGLILAMAVRTNGVEGNCEYFRIGETGRELLKANL